ncbi:MAG: phage terminase large subunit family protein [Paracoccaceae bacterium]
MAHAETIEGIRSRALAALKPPPRLSLSEWMEAHMRLPEGVSALPGRVTLWPYQRGIADAISDPAIERVTLVKPVRVGFTTLLSGALASYVANEPSPILALLPTEADARDYVVSDLEPIFEATPSLRGLISDDADESGRSTLLSRRFPGGSLKVVAAKSPRNLRRHNVRVLLIDEADAMEPGAEGSPVTLAERRTLSFANRKIILGSTPTLADTSNVLRSYAQSDQRVFEVPCPDCGVLTEVQWRHIEWQPDRPETAAFRCPHCEELIAERFKAAMVEAGDWRITRPEVEGHAGFRLNALVSTLANASWAKLAAEFVAAKGQPDQLQTFVNTILAEGWREAAEEIDEAELAGRRERIGLDAIPPEVLILTAGVDVQRDRLEIVVLGHGRSELFVLAQHVVWGSPHEDHTWAELDDFLRGQWKHPKGGVLRLDAVAIDAGDGETMDAVLSFCRPRFNRRVVAIKGASGTRPAIKASATRGARLFIVGVDGLKGTLSSHLSLRHTVRFSDSLEARFFEEIASERRVMRYRRGAPLPVWERVPGRRAEALDCTIYALAVRNLVSIKIQHREDELKTPKILERSLGTIRSAWMCPNS